MAYQTITLDVEEQIAQIELDRAEKKNAMNPQMLRELSDAIESVRNEVVVLVITGTEDAFCAGLDLDEFFEKAREKGPEVVRENTKYHREVFVGLKNFPHLTVAKVNGWTVGAGYMLMAVCDVAFAADDASFSLSEINWGHPPGGGVMWSLINTMSRRDAIYYAMSGEGFTGKRAEKLGAITKAIPAEKLDRRTEEFVTEMAKKDPLAVEYTKIFYDKVKRMSFEDAHEYELAKGEEFKYYHSYRGITEGLGKFNSGDYRPGKGENYRDVENSDE